MDFLMRPYSSALLGSDPLDLLGNFVVDPLYYAYQPIAHQSQHPSEVPKGVKRYHVGKDGFQASVDVHQFKPEEITVKAVGNKIVIEGKHEERDDGHGIISRHFTRKYSLPKDYDPNAIESTLSSDGILTVKAPPPKSPPKKEREVLIIHTGPARASLKNKDGKENKDKNEKK